MVEFSVGRDGAGLRCRGWAVIAVAVLAVAVLAVSAPALAQGSPGAGESAPDLSDVTGGSHKPGIDALNQSGLFTGTLCGEERFCPREDMKRWVMAVWLVRALDGQEPPAVEDPRFDDVNSDAWWLPHAERLAELGVTAGCKTEPLRFCPDEPVTRAQMATFLVRAFNLDPAQPAGFEDTHDNTHADTIDALAAAGVTAGCTTDPLNYCPRKPVTRAQMATFLARALGLIDTPTLVSAPRAGIDTWDRDAVLAAYETEFGRVEPDAGFTGDVDDCAAGTTSQPFRDSILQRVNWYRKMAGIAAVAEDPALTATAQRKALIMLAQGALSHTPSAEWACYTVIDHPGENLGLGTAGVRGVDEYMQDSGDNNLAVGHRQQILSAFVTQIGTGNVLDNDRPYGAANAMHLSYDWSLAPDVREVRGFVAWPPPGYVPPETVWGRWSFARQRIATEVTRSGNIIYTRLFLSGPDFSEAAVAMSDDYGPVPTRIIHRDDALVWAVDGDTDSARLAEPRDGDHCYTVAIRGVRINRTVQAPYQYAVCVLDTDD